MNKEEFHVAFQQFVDALHAEGVAFKHILKAISDHEDAIVKSAIEASNSEPAGNASGSTPAPQPSPDSAAGSTATA